MTCLLCRILDTASVRLDLVVKRAARETVCHEETCIEQARYL